MHSTLADAYIARLKQHFGVSSDDALAAKIGNAKSTIASWRRRGHIPAAVAAELKKSAGIDYAHVISTFVVDRLDHSVMGETIILLLAMRLKPPKNKMVEWCHWLTASREDILSEIVRRARPWIPEKEGFIDHLVGIQRMVIEDEFYGPLFLAELRPTIDARLPDRWKGYE